MDGKRYIVLLFTWISGLIIAFFLGQYLGFFLTIPTTENLIQWDANFYNSIRENGYEYFYKKPCNAGFFPFFPGLWYLIGDSGLAIGLVNLGIFIASLWLLIRSFRPSFSKTLLLLSFPSMFFFYVPYTETLFFLFSTFILIGFRQKNDMFIAFALFFASLVRPSFLFFIPAFGLLFLIEFEKEKAATLLKKYFLFYALPILLATGFIMLLQDLQTGNAMAYFKTQHDVWSRRFRFPKLPFGSLEGKEMYWIDVISFWLGIVLSGISIKIGRAYWKSKKSIEKYDKIFLFSLCYLLMSFLSIVFFNPTWEIRRTLLNGINRYLFANPFLFVLFWQIGNYFKIGPKQIQYLLPFSFVVWLLVDYYYLDFWAVLYYLIISLYLLLFAWYLKNRNKPILYFLVVINIFGQVYLFHRFINGLWVG